MKRILSILLCVALLVVLAACGEKTQDETKKSSENTQVETNNSSGSDSQTSKPTSSSEGTGPRVFKLRAAKYVANFDDENTVVICWGDSITQGMAMNMGFTYPQHLQGQIGSAYRVINAGVPGETSQAISSRANAIEICLTNEVKFAKGESKVALDRNLFKVVGADTPLTYKGFGNELKMDSVIIDGQKYTIEYEKGEEYDKGTYHLTRTDTSKALTIPADAKVMFDYSKQYKTVHCNVILVGANDGASDAKALIEKYKKLTVLNENYIVIIPFYSSDYSKEFKEAFGDKALDIREYFVNRAHIDYEVDLSEKDQDLVARGRIPSMYFYKDNENDCHLNEKGYKVLGEQVYKKGVELGYWK